ncbi:MAG: iron ABC transporter permease [Kiritimatiellia bacterium]|jgi:iron(III) transport system permease protein|nr:iron ABC transporter permease [Kiritimatiellia bacterium]
MLRDRTAWILTALLTGVFGVLLVWPVARVVAGGFRFEGTWTLRYVAGVFANPIYTEGLLNSLRIAIGATTLACVLAVPLAWLGHTFSFRGQRLLSALLLVPMVLPPFVGAIGLMQLFSPYGALNALLGCGPVDWFGQARYAGVILLQALSFYPIIYLNVSAALANTDPALEEAAQNLGAGLLTRVRRITLPLIMPGLFAGCTLVFIACFTELGTPLIMNVSRCAAVQVYDELKEMSASPFPFALVTVVLVCSVLLYGLSRRLFGGRALATPMRATIAHQPRPVRGLQAVLVILPFALVILLALLPHAGVVLTSVAVPGAWYRTTLPTAFTAAHYAEALGHDMTLSAIRNSLLFSFLAVLVNLVLGVTAAWVIVRSRIRARGFLDSVVMLPLAVPGLVMAFGFIALSSSLCNAPGVRASPRVAALLDIRVNPSLFLVIAYAVRRLPYMVRAAVAGLQQTSVELEEAAANLGATPLCALRRVTLPLIAANLIAGTLLAFAFSMLEVSDSLMLAQKMAFYPITKTIFELFQLVGIGRYLASALGVWAMLFLTVTIAGSSLLLGKKLGALFRA